MLLNNVIDLLLEVRPMLAGAWVAWFSAGLVLSICWHRRDKPRRVVHGSPAGYSSGLQVPAHPTAPAGIRAPRLIKPRPAPTVGVAFSELEALLASPEGTHRRPGDGSALPAPQSLP